MRFRRPQLWSALSSSLKLIVVYASPPLMPRGSKIQQTFCVIFCHIYHLIPLPTNATSLPLVVVNRRHCSIVIIVMIDCCVLALTCHLFNSTFFISYSPPTSQFITSTSSQSPSHQRQLSSLSDSSPSFVVTSCSSSSSSSPVVLVLLNSISQIHVALMNDITVLPHDDRSPS